MTTNKPLFRFNTQVVESDPTSYVGGHDDTITLIENGDI